MMKTTFSNYPQIHSKRLLLRFLSPTDGDMILALRNHPAIQQFLQRPPMSNLAAAERFIADRQEDILANRALYWGVCLKGQPRIVGTICLWSFSEGNSCAELGYELHPEFQGQGIMSEALQCVVNFGFKTLNLVRFEACTNRKNIPSIRLLEKNNFSFVRQLEASELSEAEVGSEQVIYALNATNHQQIKE